MIGPLLAMKISERTVGNVTILDLDGRLKLCNLNTRSDQVLNITKLLTVFEAFDSEAAALESF